MVLCDVDCSRACDLLMLALFMLDWLSPMVCCIQINLFSQCLLIVYRINFVQLITDNGISGVERVSGVSERSRTGGNITIQFLTR